MDIYLNPKGVQPAPTSTKKSPSGEASTKLPANPATENADMDATSLRLNELKASVASAPVINEQRVAKVAAAIQAGRYEVNPRRVADKMLEWEKQLP